MEEGGRSDLDEFHMPPRFKFLNSANIQDTFRTDSLFEIHSATHLNGEDNVVNPRQRVIKMLECLSWPTSSCWASWHQ
jgi:hypothetical protein